MRNKRTITAALLALCVLLSACSLQRADTANIRLSHVDETPDTLAANTADTADGSVDTTPVSSDATMSADELLSYTYSGLTYEVVNGNVPFFTEGDYTTASFETYSELDELGRCGAAYACIGSDLMPTEERGNISEVHPSGWHSVSYDFIDGGSLYNRSHLIAYMLTAENANERNLITGTRYLNAYGMQPFEIMVGDYIEETDNHVLYRVTPIFDGENLVASGVLMEALSMEDGGAGVCFCVYIFNVQPGVVIDYATGDSWPED